jgi:hypothetical protein
LAHLPFPTTQPTLPRAGRPTSPSPTLVLAAAHLYLIVSPSSPSLDLSRSLALCLDSPAPLSPAVAPATAAGAPARSALSPLPSGGRWVCPRPRAATSRRSPRVPRRGARRAAQPRQRGDNGVARRRGPLRPQRWHRTSGGSSSSRPSRPPLLLAFPNFLALADLEIGGSSTFIALKGMEGMARLPARRMRRRWQR